MVCLISELFIQKIFLSFLIGALLGLEREFTKKQEVAGLRTFSLVSLFGCLAVYLATYLQAGAVLIGFAFVCLLMLIFYITAPEKKGFTTHISLIITYVLGTFVGYGLFTEAIFLAILVAIVLFSKERLHHAVRHLNQREVGDLLEFLILLGIVYPILPQSTQIAGIEVPLFTIWWLIVLITLMNFAAFLASRFLHTKYELGIVSFLSGLACSTATTASLISLHRQNKRKSTALSMSFLLASSGMLIRNFAFLMIAVPQTIYLLGPPLAFATCAFVGIAFLAMRRGKENIRLRMDSPFNVTSAVKLGATIFVLFLLFNLTKVIGAGYFFLSAFFGGFVDSGGTSISLASVLMQDPGTLKSAAFGVLLASVGAVAANYLLCALHRCNSIIRKSILPIAVVFAVTAAFLYLLTL